MKLRYSIPVPPRAFAALLFALCLCAQTAFAQQAPASQRTAEKPAEKKTEKKSPPEKAENPAQIELLETKVRFEANGDSRKEVHARVKINSELGVRQFARLNFDYNRAFQSIEIPLVHITHTSGGTADILPSAISDNPNPAVVNYPAYQDVRVKSVRILGLEPGDLLEYRVITTTTHHPLAPDFWFDHSFDRTGVVSQEIFDLDLPTARTVQMHVNPATPASSTGKSGEGDQALDSYHWESASRPASANGEESKAEESDVVVTSFVSWEALAKRLEDSLRPASKTTPAVSKKAMELAGALSAEKDKFRALYDFVSQKIFTIDLPLDATDFQTRPSEEILLSGYATSEDKFALFSSLASALRLDSAAALLGNMHKMSGRLPRPSLLSNCLVVVAIAPLLAPGASCGECSQMTWLDPAVEVAPFAALPASLRGKQALLVSAGLSQSTFLIASEQLPFPSTQKVNIDARLESEGKLTAKVHYSLRGDNELLLRVAFHQTPKERWKELAQLLSISDGFRGQVASVNASDPYATKEPFTVEYEIEQPKFVDWSKKPVRIPALLPQLGLPDPPAQPAPGKATSPIQLGTPLEVETHMTLVLPPGTTAFTPTGTSVQRDYATFSSKYAAQQSTITASRHIHFISREVSAERAADYNAFLRAVQSDEAQDFTLERPAAPPSKPSSSHDPAPHAPQSSSPKP